MYWLLAIIAAAGAAVGPLPCSSALFSGNRLSDPAHLPIRLKIQRVESDSPFTAPTTLELAGLHPVDLALSTALIPISAQNILNAYARGWKLYHHFDVEGSLPEWQSPAFRGIINFARTNQILKESGFLKELRKLTHNKAGIPIYDIRFNHDIRRAVQSCGTAQRAMQNTMTKEVIHDPTGKTLLWKKTWLSPEIQNAFIEIIEKGLGYSIEIYTNEHHPFHALSLENNHLVAGTFGIGENGTYTGISVFLNRLPHPDKPNRVAFDGAGKLAFFTEIDALDAAGAVWLDAVTVNALPREMGAYFVHRDEFDELRAAGGQPSRFIAPPGNYSIHYNRWGK